MLLLYFTKISQISVWYWVISSVEIFWKQNVKTKKYPKTIESRRY